MTTAEVKETRMTRRRSAAAAVVLCALLSACDVASGGAAW